MISFMKERRLTLAYLIITLAMIVGFLRVEHVAKEVEKESELRIESACEAFEDSKSVLRSVVLLLGRHGEVSPTMETFRIKALNVLDNTTCDIQ